MSQAIGLSRFRGRTKPASSGRATAKHKKMTRSDWIENIKLYALLAPVLIHLFLFSYRPLYGILIAFQDYHPGDSFLSFDGNTTWVGFQHFATFLSDPMFGRLLRNTIWLNVLYLIFGFVAPILFALLLNEIMSTRYKKFVQTASYMPHFISSVVIAGIVMSFINGEGIINDLMAVFGVEPSNLLTKSAAFPAILTITSVWRSFGWESILYISNLSGIDPGLYESAKLDGANRAQRMWYISLPALKNLIMIQLIFAAGGLLSSSTDLILLFYNPSTYETADVIGTYIYRVGLTQPGNFSYTAAIGLFTNVINFTLVFICNKISTKVADFGLW